MDISETRELNGFIELLSAPERSPEIPESSDVYGWLVGSWDLEVLHYGNADLRSQRITGEVHFAWVLEGRAIQDVWIMPSVIDCSPESDRTKNMYGTTLRIWNPANQNWHIRWIDPVNGREDRQTGRRIGNEIVQIGAKLDGTPTRWRFTELTPDSFHWIGEALDPDGKNWTLEGEFLARRRPGEGRKSVWPSRQFAHPSF